MKITAIKTPIVRSHDTLNEVISSSIPALAENCVLTIASKIFATCEGRFVPKVTGEKSEKFELVKKEADLYLDAEFSKYQLMHTIKRSVMFVSAGIDESNADNQYILWPSEPQEAVNSVWRFLRDHYHLENVGVIMTDSTSRPLTWGVVGAAVAYCGFEPLKSYIDKPDLFGRVMVMEQVSVVQSLAAAGTFVTGEGDESTPIAVLSDIPAIVFQNHEPSDEELSKLQVSLEDDAYAPLLQAVKWQKGGGGIKF